MIALLSTAYWAPVSYYKTIETSAQIYIEQHERYQKQSYRNRCVILSANGPLCLTVPVLRPHDCPIREARIDYTKPWQQMHWRAIEAAYRSSAFFEEYGAEVKRLYQQQESFLFDLNIRILELSRSLLGQNFTWELTPAFMPLETEPDFRFSIHPKKERALSRPALHPYFQIFSTKFGFIPNLSVLDLIFNTGPFGT